MLKAVSKRIRSLRPVQILTLGFLSVVLIGAGLLCIPFATVKEGTDITFMDALFTATSAVCVTGLTVVNTGLVFTLFGKLVILSLMQIGGLGFMTIASILFMVVGKRISLKERLLIQESFNTDSLQGMVRLVRNAVAVTFAVEGIAAPGSSRNMEWGRGFFTRCSCPSPASATRALTPSALRTPSSTI